MTRILITIDAAPNSRCASRRATRRNDSQRRYAIVAWLPNRDHQRKVRYMLRALVSGPFRGKDHWEIARNIRAAETIALASWRAGLATYCPHTSTAHFQDAAPDDVWLTGHLAWMEVADVVILTADWHRSAVARRELMEAAELGIQAFVVSEEQDDDPEMLLTESYAIKPVDDGEECDYDLEDDLLEDDETTPFRFALVDLTLGEWVKEREGTIADLGDDYPEHDNETEETP